jgi:6-phosphofructokinase 1
MTINRKDKAEYSIFYDSADISGIANAVRSVPLDFVNDTKNGVTEDCISYLLPLICGEVSPVYENGLPTHIKF